MKTGPASSRAPWIATLAALGVAVAASRWFVHANGPDDYDSFSFLLGMRDQFDLARFQPQFPGYPVYIALGRALIAIGISPIEAATSLTAVASGTTAVALALIAERLQGRRAALVTGALYLVAWLPLETGAGMLSEPLACALAAAALAFLVVETPRPLVAGILAGLLLGARASYWPFVVSLLIAAGAARLLRRHLAGLALGLLAWVPAFVVAFGPRTLWQLGVTHLAGHFESWGNSVVTRPDLGLRLVRFARDVFFDGVAPDWRALAAIAVVLVAVLILVARSRAWPAPRNAWAWAIVLGPYAMWAFFAQNVLTQPRHVLPIVVGVILILGLVLSSSAIAAALSVAIVGLISLPLAWERHTTPPGPAQAAAWVAGQVREDVAGTAIFASRSVRFFVEAARGWPVPWTVESCGRRSDVYVVLGRVDRFPDHIFLTDEVDLQPDVRLPGVLSPGPTFCRDPRIDRAVPCVQIYELDWKVR